MAVRFTAESQAFTTTVQVPNGAYTVTWWAKVSVDRGSVYSTMWEPGSTGDTSLYTQIGPEGDGVTMGVHTSTGAVIGSAFTMAVGVWYCFGLVQTGDGGTIRLYAGTDPDALTLYTSTGTVPSTDATTLRVGRSVWSGEWLNGCLAAWKQWNAALTAAEIGAELESYDAFRTSGLIRVIKFLTAVGTDSSGNARDLSGGSGATTETGPAALVDAVPKAGADSGALADTGAPLAAHDGANGGGLTSEVASPPVIAHDGPDTAAVVTEGASLVKYVEVVINGAPVAVGGGGVDVAHRVDMLGAGLRVGGGTVDTSHVVDVLGAGVYVLAGETFGGNTNPRGGGVHVVGGGVDVGKAGSAAQDYGVPARTIGPRARVIAQRILTGEFLSWELPLTNPEIVHELGGSTQISGAFVPEMKALRDMDLEPWATWLHMEEDGVILGSAILKPGSITKDGRLTVESIGPMGYSDRVPFRGQYSGIQVDPADIVRMIWAHIQGFARANFGLTVTGSTPRTVGTAARDVEFVTGEGEVVEFVAGPYQLNYWNKAMCGAEIEKLSTETPFDLIERSFWTSSARTAIGHRIELVYPQRGTRRTDLAFVEGQNILEFAPPEEPDDAYADTVYLDGKGEGIDGITAEATVWVSNRIRMPALLDDKTVDNTDRARAMAREELAARLSALVEVPEIVIDTRHANAPIGSFDVGDEILIDVMVPYRGRIRQWHRITSIRYLPHTARAVLALTRRGAFR